MISILKLVDFTCFGEAEFQFCKGINVFIGANSTGKTHILKLLGASLKAGEEFTNGALPSRERAQIELSERLVGYFRPEKLGRLVRRKQGRTRSEVEIGFPHLKPLRFNFANNAQYVKIEDFHGLPQIPSLYLPPKEMLTLYEGFIGLYEGREVAFDEVYYQLAKSLNPPPLRGPRANKISNLIKRLEEEFKGKVVKEGNRFYLQDANGKLEANLVAEGMRKIASIAYLIINGKLSENTVLFWDEPESNLNPQLIKLVAELLRQLAASGVQIFIATHDFLLTHYLSLYHEHAEKPEAELRFFSLEKDEEMGIIIDTGEFLSEIQSNLILDEFAEYYDAEQRFFTTAND